MPCVAAPVRYVAWVFYGFNRFMVAITAPRDGPPLEELLHLAADEVVTVSVLH